MPLNFVGYRETKRHIELIWREEQRKDFLSRLLIITLTPQEKNPCALRVSDSEIGSAFIKLDNWRIFAERWETEEEVEESSELSSRFSSTLTKVVSKKAEKRVLFKKVMAAVKAGMTDYPKVSKFLDGLTEKNRPRFDPKPFLRQRYFKPQVELISAGRVHNTEAQRKKKAEKTRILIDSPNSVVTFFALLIISLILLVMIAKGYC